MTIYTAESTYVYIQTEPNNIARFKRACAIDRISVSVIEEGQDYFSAAVMASEPRVQQMLESLDLLWPLRTPPPQMN